MSEVDGAVDRVEYPVGVLIAEGTVFFAEETDLGVPVVQQTANEVFDGEVDVGIRSRSPLVLMWVG